MNFPSSHQLDVKDRSLSNQVYNRMQQVVQDDRFNFLLLERELPVAGQAFVRSILMCDFNAFSS